MNTDTPETDAMISADHHHLEDDNFFSASFYWRMCDLARRIERELTAVTEQRDRLAEALRNIKNELGVPQPEYPAPVANAVKIADEAIQSLTPKP